MTRSSQEVKRQLDRIVALGYPDVADISAAAFRALAQPLISALESTELGEQILLIPTRELVSPESLIARTSINRMAGFTTMLGSHSADGRVPSIWMSQNAPRLGSVWPNSRHTWLGNAYCEGRRGVSLFQ